MKKRLFRKFLPFIFSISVFLLAAVILKNQIITEQQVIRELDIHLVGEVKKITKLEYGHDYGIINIKIKESNYNYYDERNKIDKFIGVKKDGEAEIVVTDISSYMVNDLYVLKENNYKIYRNDNKVKEVVYEYLTGIGIVSPYTEVKKKLTL